MTDGKEQIIMLKYNFIFEHGVGQLYFTNHLNTAYFSGV